MDETTYRSKSDQRAWRGWVLALTAATIPFLGSCTDPNDIEGDLLNEIFHFDVDPDIHYASAQNEDGVGEPLYLDVFYPTDDPDRLRPAVLWLHGGSFMEGGKGEMTEYGRRFAQRGYVSLTVEYRLHEDGGFDYTDPDDALAEEVKRDAQHDAQGAVRWLRANSETYRVNTDRIYVVGYSSGGTTALRVAAWPDDPGETGNTDQASNVAGAAAISGYIDAGVLEASTGPTLLIHGEADTKVPFSFVDSACSAVARCNVIMIPQAPHNMLDGDVKERVISELATFLHSQVAN